MPEVIKFLYYNIILDTKYLVPTSGMEDWLHRKASNLLWNCMPDRTLTF